MKTEGNFDDIEYSWGLFYTISLIAVKKSLCLGFIYLR